MGAGGTYRCPRCHTLWLDPGRGGQQVCVPCVQADRERATRELSAKSGVVLACVRATFDGSE